VLDQINIDARIVSSCVREIANSRRNPPDTVDYVLAELERAGLVQSGAALRLG
jgi:DNA-binding IscR family transcriptional regulator